MKSPTCKKSTYRLLLGGRSAADGGEIRYLVTPEDHIKSTSIVSAEGPCFGFPFIMAIKGKSKAEILAAFESRLKKDADAETRTAFAEIDRIAALRNPRPSGEDVRHKVCERRPHAGFRSHAAYTMDDPQTHENRQLRALAKTRSPHQKPGRSEPPRPVANRRTGDAGQ